MKGVFLKNINILFNSWDSFSMKDVNNPDNFQRDIYEAFLTMAM